MKIAFIRGPSLNSWEMQNYLPLAKKHDFLAVGSRRGNYLNEEKTRIEKLICLGELFYPVPFGIELLHRFYGDPQVLLGFEKVISGFDILHTAELGNYYSLQAVRACQKGLAKKTIVTCWENLGGTREDYPSQKKIKKEVAVLADHFLAVTNQAKAVLLKEGVLEEKITVLPMGVDLESFSPKRKTLVLRNSLSLKPDTKIVLFVGRLVKEKGIYQLLDAAYQLIQRKRRKNLSFLLVGEGPEKDKLKSLALRKGIASNFILAGEIPYGQIPEYFVLADIFVLPSQPTEIWEEQFGMVLIEAMASGVPVVSTKTGAIPEVVGKEGLLVEANNSQQLSQAINEILDNNKLRIRLITEGLKRVKQKYDCRKVALEIEKLYQRVLGDTNEKKRS